MVGGKKVKVKGTSFEYRVRNYFRNEDEKPDWPIGWKSERNDLSGASVQFQKEISKHDVRAWKGNIFLQIEAKSTYDRETINIRKEWLDKINFNNDEILVIGFYYDQTIYACIPLRVYWDLQGICAGDRKHLLEDFEDAMSPRGKVQFKFKKEYFEGGDNFVFNWEVMSTYYVIFPLAQYIELRQQYTQLMEGPDHLENIKKINNLEELVSYEAKNRDTLTLEEGLTLTNKITRRYIERETGEEIKVSPEFRAKEQWWLKGTDKEPVVLYLNKEVKEKIAKKYKKLNKKVEKEVSMTKMIYDIVKDYVK